MRSDHNILIAFILNLFFSIFELAGGFFTGSVSILSDAIHDFGDAISIGISYFLEKKSYNKLNEVYTFGYTRCSVFGALITSLILAIGSTFMITQSIIRFFNPVDINYNGMIIFAVVGIVVNFLAVLFTNKAKSLNQKAINLHMFEDVLGWIIVLIGSILIKFTNINYIDSIMSIFVSIFILIHAIKNILKVYYIFLEKIPDQLSSKDIRNKLLIIKEVEDVHHMHIWSLDGVNNFATMHVVTDVQNTVELKKKIKKLLNDNFISHVTIEFETTREKCKDKKCKVN